MTNLTSKQKLFVEEYLLDLNATQAASRAGYSPKTAHRIGAENMQKPAIAAEIAKRQEDRAFRTETRQDDVIQALKEIAFSNLAEVAEWEKDGLNLMNSDSLPSSVTRAIQRVKRSRHSIDISLYPKIPALELLGKHLGMFKPQGELDINMKDKDSVIETLMEKLSAYKL